MFAASLMVSAVTLWNPLQVYLVILFFSYPIRFIRIVGVNIPNRLGIAREIGKNFSVRDPRPFFASRKCFRGDPAMPVRVVKGFAVGSGLRAFAFEDVHGNRCFEALRPRLKASAKDKSNASQPSASIGPPGKFV